MLVIEVSLFKACDVQKILYSTAVILRHAINAPQPSTDPGTQGKESTALERRHVHCEDLKVKFSFHSLTVLLF